MPSRSTRLILTLSLLAPTRVANGIGDTINFLRARWLLWRYPEARDYPLVRRLARLREKP